jgi:translation initiation factor IF-2
MVEWLGLEFGKNILPKKDEPIEESILKSLQQEDDPADLGPRAPVVTFMGHVDHGKTSLLDRIRQTNVAAYEAGGITQHIGASKVSAGRYEIVFLDTPGHEAFTAMRSRGAHITDIVVLVVAADDGVMPQTVEAISHAKAANVPIVVALNKIDKPTARPEFVLQQLTKQGLIAEKWHGDTGILEVSALTGQGVPELLEYLGLMAEVLELKANPKRKALGVVLESRIVEGKGIVANLLIRNGTLNRGDNILCGTSYGRVRDITDHTGKSLSQAGPSTPVEISGLSELPEAGDRFYILEDISLARNIAEDRKKKLREKSLAKGVRKLTIEDILKQIKKGEIQELRIILKTDVHGSLEAITPKLEAMSTEKVKIKLLHAAVGGINERDIQLSDASQAIVLGFSVTANKMARDMAEEKKVQIRYYNIIYQLFEDVQSIIQGMLIPESREEIIGHATVRQVFHISKLGNIAGCYITDGIIERSSKIRLARNGVVLSKDKPLIISCLKHLKEDVGKVREGFECGIRLEGYEDLKEGDELEAYKLVTQKIPG